MNAEPELSGRNSEAFPKSRATLVASFIYALSGLLRTICTQRNMKIHWVAGTAVMLVGMALPLDVGSRTSLMSCVALVLSMEVLNTALEAFVDLHVKQFARMAMVAKDAAAAAVLLLSMGAAVIFSDILLHRWSMVVASGRAVMETVVAGVPLLVALALGLWMRRNVFRLVVLLAICVMATAYLAFDSRDKIFSLGTLGFVSLGFLARFMEPRLLIPGAPQPPARSV